MTRPLRTAYTTLNRVIQRINADSSNINVSTSAAQTTQINTESANFQAEMVKCIYIASDMISDSTSNVFVPYVQTHTWRRYAYRADWIFDPKTSEYILSLPDRLLSVTSLTFSGTAMAASGYYLRYEQRPPYYEIAIYSDTTFTLPSASSETIALVGIWGYHTSPDSMWLDSGDTVQDNPLSASATTLNVSDGTNFQILQYIRIEDEYLLITAISTNALTVTRGMNGTTAAAHVQTTQIDTYEPIEAVADECARLAIRRYQLRSGIEIVATGKTAFELKIGDVKLPSRYTQYYYGSA